MTALIWLIPVALLLGLIGLRAFIWALKSGQFDDLEGAAYRILDDDTIIDASSDSIDRNGGPDGGPGDGQQADGGHPDGRRHGKDHETQY